MAKIDIKGINSNLVIVFSHGRGEEYEALLKNRFETNPQLFQGYPVSFSGDGLQALSSSEVVSLQRLCLNYGMILHNVHTPGRLENTASAGPDLFVYRTMRSGQRAHSEGSLVIWGNVHESSEVTAAKDVIVLGKLEGIAHAGCYGDVTSTIFALNLCPKQLRIGDKISRSTGEYNKNSAPGLAYTEGDNICIKQYTPR